LKQGNLTRRTLLATAGATVALSSPFVRSANAAGRLKVALIDHWVPGANDAMRKVCNEWAEKEKVELSIDFVTTVGDTITLVGSAEALAKTGHDIMAHLNWAASSHSKSLEPVDDLMKELVAQHGPASAAVEYIGKQTGKWLVVPSVTATQAAPCLARIDLLKEHAGVDITAMYPGSGEPNKELVAKWTWEAFLTAAEKCHKAGFSFGMPLGQTPDSVNWVGSVFAAYGAMLIDQKGAINAKSDPVRQVLEYFKRLVPFLPEGAFAWDDSGNNKWILSGRGSLIMSSPSPWAVAKRENVKLAEQIWHFPPPSGPKGQFVPRTPSFLGIWNFSPNKSAAKSLIMHLWQRQNVERLVAAGQGNDIPAFAKLLDFSTWREEGPPKGTLYNYPARGPVIETMAGHPAPPELAKQIFSRATMTNMIARYTQGGQPMATVLDWATRELEGYLRG
jgi:hypothetical protein